MEKSFQEIDIEKAINQSSFLFKYDTGLGKSYVLSGCLAHLRYFNECWKALVLTSSIGIMNLNGEIQKFVAQYDPSRTLVISSITELKDRLVFSNDNWDIIICGYSTFKSINDAYKKALNDLLKISFVCFVSVFRLR